MRRISAILVCILGIFLMILGIGRMSWWAPSDVSEITFEPGDAQNSPFIVLDNDVRKSLQPPIQVEVKSADNFSVSQGNKEDTLAWLGGVKHATTANIEDGRFVVNVEGDQPDAPDPAGADIWYESSLSEKEYDGRWESPKNGEWDLVIASDGKKAAPTDIKITSLKHIGFVIPVLLLVFGGILSILGLLGAIFAPRRKRSGGLKSRDFRTRARDGYSARHRPSKMRTVSHSPKGSSRAPRPGLSRRYSVAIILPLLLSAAVAVPALAAQNKSEENGVLESKQLQRVVDNISKVVARAEQNLSVGGLDARLGQPELSLRNANYAVRKENSSHPALSPISGVGEEGFGIVRRYVQEDRQWPRTVSMVTQGGKDQSAQYIVMSQQDARSNYKVNQVIPIVQGQTALGAKQLPPQAVNWLSAEEKVENLAAPEEVIEAFATLLNGDAEIRNRFVSNDAVFSQVDSQNKIDDGAELVRPTENKFDKSEIKAFKSVDGGLLVSGVINTVIAQRPKEGKVIKLPPQQKALAGKEEVAGTVTIQTAEPVMIVFPKDGGAMQVVGFSRSYVKVTADGR